MPHPPGGMRWVLEWKLRIWLDTRFIIFGGFAAGLSLRPCVLACIEVVKSCT